MLVTYKYKLYASKQNKHLHRQINVAGCVWNHCIALHRRYYRLYGKSLNKYQLKKHITKLKKQPRYAFWCELGSQAIQDVVLRIDKAYKLFFRNLKAGIKTAPPSFRKVKKYKSFTLTQAGWALNGHHLRIGKRIYKFAKSRDVNGIIKTVTIKRNALGEVFVCFAVLQDSKPNERRTGNIAAFDFGLKTFLTSSDGELIDSPQFFKQSQKQLASLQKRFAKKRRGSSSHRALKRQIASLHERIKNQRRDWFFKLAHKLTDTYDVLIFETLNLKGMQRLWGRKVNDLAFYSFLGILEYVAATKNKTVHYVDRWFASSKTCNHCGHKNTALTLQDRYWRCSRCGNTQDRDVGAAINLLREGIHALGKGDVRRAERAITV